MTPDDTDRSRYRPRLSIGVPTCVDLFCGAGGLTLGFCQAGGLPVAAVDHDRESIASYRQMFSICPEVHCSEIRTWHPEIDPGSVDVIIGGPPCQGFSLARGFRFLNDPRNHLYKEFVRLVSRMNPRWVVMENVPGITNIGRGVLLEQIREDFADIGYWIECRVINMAEYGVPQTRRRAIFVGSRVTDYFSWPEATHSAKTVGEPSLFGERDRFISVRAALGDLPWPLGSYFSHRANSQMRGPRNRRVDVDAAFTLRVRGDEFALCETAAVAAFAPGPAPQEELSWGPVTDAFQVLMREPPPPWVRDYQAPPTRRRRPPALKGCRRLTVREQARLQSFPDWFTFAGNPYAQGRQIGNAVPPRFARMLFAAIFRRLRDADHTEHDVRGDPKCVLDSTEVS
jgi:DNA (cytosine-5)-methyltransferase 1